MNLATFCIVSLLSLPLTGQAFAQTSSTTPQAHRKYNVGQRVELVDGGKWYKAVITKVASDEDIANFGPYHVYYVHSLGYTWDRWVGDYADQRAQLRAAGAGATEPIPGGETNDDVLKAMHGTTAAAPAQPAAKQYNCGVGASFTITGSGTYTDSDGRRGTYSFVPASSTLTFSGGNYDGQRAQFETSYGLAKLHILGPSGRPVIDCD
jgi:hypothetical protein